jgi:hypothetical protein
MKPLSDDSQEQSTIDYYNTNAKAFIERTVEIDLTANYAAFLRHLPEGGRILDAGCGSGRDTEIYIILYDI